MSSTSCEACHTRENVLEEFGLCRSCLCLWTRIHRIDEVIRNKNIKPGLVGEVVIMLAKDTELQQRDSPHNALLTDMLAVLKKHVRAELEKEEEEKKKNAQ